MPFPSAILNQPTPPSDEHILPPPAAHISARRLPSAATGGLSTRPTRLIANTDLRCQIIQEDAEDGVAQVEHQERQTTDLEAGQLAEIPQRTGRSSSVCVFCLASRDVCIELG